MIARTPPPRRTRRGAFRPLLGLAGLVVALGVFVLISQGRETLPGPPTEPVPNEPPARPPQPAPEAAPPEEPEAAPSPLAVPDASLVIGVHEPVARPVIDGDTLLLDGLSDSVRVRSVDTEEIFHEGELRREAEADFDAYAGRMQGGARMPQKYGTPAGEAAKAFVERLFERVTSVRLERDAPGDSVRDTYGRVLAHVILIRPEGELLLAEELVRRGHSPYFVKYGRSLRFDERLTRAEGEAKAAQRGIWGTSGPPHYPDYDTRLVWWHRRAAQVDWWRALAPSPDRFTLGLPADAERLAERIGQTVTVFGLVREMKTEGRPKILYLGNPPARDLPVVMFDGATWSALDLDALTERYVVVTGALSLYRERPQIVVQDASQIVSP